MNLHALIAELCGQVWAIQPHRLQALAASLQQSLASGKPPEAAQLQAEVTATPGAVGSVGVLPILGTLVPRGDRYSEFFGEAACDRLAAKLQQLVAAPDVKTILLLVDSPGGMVQGIPELADALFAARAQKRIVAMCNFTCASAAYWLASQAHEVVCAPSGWVGSIGAYFLHLDWSKAYELAGIKPTLVKSSEGKGEFSDFQPLSPEDMQRLQTLVEDGNDQFVKAVARGRGVTPATVRGGFGAPELKGRVFTAAEAQKLGVIDRVATLDQTLLRLISASTRRTGAGAQITRPDFEALLRNEGGLSRDAAKSIAALAYKEVLSDPGNGAVEEDPQLPAAPRYEGGTDDTAQGLAALTQSLSRLSTEVSHGSRGSSGD